MGKINIDFDTEKLYLGRLCKRGHKWKGKWYSLRHKNNKHCVICQKEANKARHQYGEFRDKILERKRELYRMKRDKQKLEN